MFKILILTLFIIITFNITSCQIYNGEELDGGKFQQSGLRLDLPGKKFDIDIMSSKKRVLSPEEHKEAMRRKAKEEELNTELEAAKRERMYKIETKEKKRTILLWLSCICYGLSVAFVVAGIFLEGWKVFSTIAVAMMAFGIFFMVLINMLPIMTVIIMVPIGIAVFRLLYMFKDVAFNKKKIDENVVND